MRYPNGLDYLLYKDGLAFNSLNFGMFGSIFFSIGPLEDI